MVHIITVHWESDKWIDIQLKYLQLHTEEQFRVYAFLNHLPADHSGKFYYSSKEPIKDHSVKLNILANVVGSRAESDDDLLIFLDGDAFPVRRYLPFIREKTLSHKLVAVQRLENNGDVQPHPSFCATTTGFWKEIKGDWQRGYTWRNSKGRTVTDVGGNLLKILEDNAVDWYPLLRSNTRNYHPVFFGMYGGLVYHHGSGFRVGTSRAARRAARDHDEKLFSRLLDSLPGRSIFSPLIDRLHPGERYRRKMLAKNSSKSLEMWEKIRQDTDFFRELT